MSIWGPTPETQFTHTLIHFPAPVTQFSWRHMSWLGRVWLFTLASSSPVLAGFSISREPDYFTCLVSKSPYIPLLLERELWPSFMHGCSICLCDLYELTKNVYKFIWKQQDNSFFLLWQRKRIVHSVTLDLTVSCLYWKIPHKVYLMSDQTDAIWSY